jgi:hypothetical protein
MSPTRCVALLSVLAGTVLDAQAPEYLVVPAAYAKKDAVSYEWIAGASRDVRQQTLIAEAHLAGVIGKRLQAIELRRTAANEVYAGGTATMTVTLSTSPHTPLTCSSQYAANVGADAVEVFSGPVTLPTSPAVTSGASDWTPLNIVRIEFTSPFEYLGGTLCVDVVGAPVAGQNANWWMADAEFENLIATATDFGGGCGPYGGPQGLWSYVAKRTLIPGGHARFFAYGVPNSLAVAVFGAGSPVGVPMAALGFPSPPTCEFHLSSLLMMQVAVFVPETEPGLMSRGGRADLELQFGYDPSFLGLTCTTQWVDLLSWTTSNAIQWTTASSVPTLGMALNEGSPAESGGEVSVHLAHVMRFEYL